MELCLVVDHACNLRCRYCYMGDKRSAPMSREVSRKAAELALASNDDWLSVTLFGGEPLLRTDGLQTVQQAVNAALRAHAKPVQLRWLLDTNATLLDAASATWLAAQGNCRVFVSLDGIAAAHDTHRLDLAGQPTHARVLRGIEHLRARNIPFDVIAVVSPETVSCLGQSLAFLLTTGAAAIRLQANLRARWNETDLVRFEQSACEAAQLWVNEFRQGRAPVVEPYHTKVLTHLVGGERLPCRCQLATREFAVAPSGRIYPCAEMVGADNRHELTIGHVDTGFDDAALARLRQLTQNVWATCEHCALYQRCMSGCGCAQLASTGQLGQVNAAFCRIEAAWIDAADQAAAALFDQQCPTFLEYFYQSRWSRPLAPAPLVQLGSKARVTPAPGDSMNVDGKH